MAADATTPLPPPPVQMRAPRAGELTGRWRILMTVTWVCVVAAFVAVWRVSDQLGLATWWIGPRGEPNPRMLQVLPFVPAVMMVLTSINRVRHASWWGLLASAAIVAVGAGDLGRVFRLGVIEISIGVAAAAVSVASFSGTYRRRAS